MNDTASPNANVAVEDKLIKDISPRATIETLVVAGITGSFEGWVHMRVASDLATWPMAIVLHLCAIAWVGAFVVLCIRRDTGVRGAVVLLIAEAALGPLGCAGTVLMLCLFFVFKHKARSFLAWYLDLFPPEQKTLGQDLFDKLVTGRAREEDSESVAAFADLLDHGTPQQKQVILALLARNFQPVFAPVLRRAMNDTDSTVRVMAATAVAKIENEFLKHAMSMRHECQRRPHDRAAWLAMARLHDDYAFTGLLDIDREHENRTLAEEAFRHCIDIMPTDVASWLALGRLCLREGRVDEAIAAFTETARIEPRRADVVAWLMEARFRQGDFAAVRRLAQDLGHDLDSVTALGEDVKRVARLWRGGERT